MAGPKKRAAGGGKGTSTSSSVAKKKAGDWRASNVSMRTLTALQKEGQIPSESGSIRKPDKEEEVPRPRGNERVIFADHVSRGLSFPLHPFLRALLYVYGIQLHDLPPNAVQHIACFIVLCEYFLGIRPHWGLSWKRIFFVKMHREAPTEGEKYGVPCAIGGFGIQVKKDVEYYDMKFLASIQNWRRRWFYVRDPDSREFPKFESHAVLTRKKSWRHRVTADDIEETAPLMDQISALRKTESGSWINGLHLACVFVKHRVQPLHDCLRPMWEYSGPKDPSRTRADELSPDEFDTRSNLQSCLQIPLIRTIFQLR